MSTEKSSENKQFSPERFKKVRLALDKSGEEFAKPIDRSKAYISQVENGRKIPEDIYLEKLCSVYGINMEYLFGGDAPMFSKGEVEEPSSRRRRQPFPARQYLAEVREVTAAYRGKTLNLTEQEVQNLVMCRDLPEGLRDEINESVREAWVGVRWKDLL